MSADETYNGWTNRETWAVALHINNDQGWQGSVHEALRNADPKSCPDCGTVGDYAPDFEGFRDCRECGAAWTPGYTAGQVIRENVEVAIEPDTDIPEVNLDRLAIALDIGSLWRVNWTELGASFLSDIEESD